MMPNPYKYIDLSYLQDFSGGDGKFISELISTAIEQTGDDVVKLKEALAIFDSGVIAQICHKLRSSMGFMGVSAELIEKLRLIEKLGEKNPERLRVQIEEVIVICNHVNSELKQELKNRKD